MKWDSPTVKQSLIELKELLFLQGRDSRVVRFSFAYSRFKKQYLDKLKQVGYGFSKRQKKPNDRLKIFFWLPGGLGDACCAKRLVDAYLQLMPGAEAEIYSPVEGVVSTVFAGKKEVKAVCSARQYWGNYDLVVLVCLGVKFLAADEKRLSQLAPQFKPVYQRALTAQKELGFLWEDPFLTEPVLGRWLLKMGGRRFDLMSFTGGVELPHNASEKLSPDLSKLVKWGLTPYGYITFHDAAAGKLLPTRMWPRKHWEELLSLIKKNYPMLKIVQLGVRENPAYPQADLCLCGQTELHDLPVLLQGTRLHIDSESGLVHLAQYLCAKSIVLFGPSDKDFFAYQKNINLSAGDCGGCMWMTTGWMQHCPLSGAQATCLQEISPAQTYKAVQSALNQ